MARLPPFFCRLLLAGIGFGGPRLCGQEAAPTAADVRALVEQNRQLQDQVRAQQAQIDELRNRLDDLAGRDRRRAAAIDELQSRAAAPAPAEVTRRDNTRPPEIRISGVAGLGYFDAGPQGQFPNAEFRADDVKVFLEAPVWRDTYFFAEMDLVTREASDEYFHLGEVYVDFEDVSGRLGGPARLVNLRVGRFDLPFGEEYQRRDVMTNPLIAHSLSDIWGIDEGVEVYGSAGRFSYVVAVQNGGHKTLHDYDSDKSVIARVGFDPIPSLHLSASAMRTGDLTVTGDSVSEVWFGGGFFRALGPAATTTNFDVRLFELDAAYTWHGGGLRAAGGEVRFDDNDTSAENRRDLTYHYIEAVQDITRRLYGAARYSHIDAGRGYPLVGLGDFGTFLFRSAPTDELSRLTVGLGYRFADALLFKFDYSWENGRLVNGTPRDLENLLSAEIGLTF